MRVSEWLKLPKAVRKGRNVPIIISETLYAAGQSEGYDMSVYATPDPMPAIDEDEIYITVTR